MTDDVELFRPDAICPTCHRPPRLAYTREQLAKWANDHPHAVVQTYQCATDVRPGRKCNTIYRILAGDLHRARAAEATASRR